MVVMNNQGEEVRIPVEEITDAESFCLWARSSAYPSRGRFSYLNGECWVDLSMEQLFTHNRVKLRIASALDALITSEDLGYFVADRMLLHNEFADFATEPDGMFISYASIESEKAQLKEGAGVVEIVGTPDMVLEVVSDSSEHKDNVELMDLYGQAGIPEYWLVDVRSEPYHFDIFKKAGKGYAATRRLAGGWLKSAVYGRAFHLAAQTDALGHPQFTLEVR